MSCGCDNKKRLKDISIVRELAKKVAKLDQCVYVVYESPAGIFDFIQDGEKYEGKFIEYIYW